MFFLYIYKIQYFSRNTALVGASTVVASGLTPEKIFDGDFNEGTTMGGGLEAGVGMGANIQHNLSYTFVIPLTK